MALTILQLVKYLPMTNCGDCGYPCLAFASHVIKKERICWALFSLVVENLQRPGQENQDSAEKRPSRGPRSLQDRQVLFWDEDKKEGFEAQAKVLFDETISCFLDIESAVFLAEKMASRLIEEGHKKTRSPSVSHSHRFSRCLKLPYP